jgi:pimeloyl-ACP methyl ester carboxylesterase
VGPPLPPAPLPAAVSTLGIVVGALLLVRVGAPASDPLQPLHRMLPHISILPPCQGERVELETGSVAWYDPPRFSSPRPAALVFHGADPRGSRQPAACSLRRALLDAGYGVLSIDHPGYGRSPAPGFDLDLSSWDPLVHQVAALEWLDARSDIDRLGTLAGHSMGAMDALRLVAEGRGGDAVFLFGMGLGGGDAGPADADYWFERFHTDRGMSERLTVGQWEEIGVRYYHFDVLIRGVPSEHPLVVFVDFGWEWDDVAASRDPPFRAIPGEKVRWTLPHSSHYFNTFSWYGLHGADVRTIRSVSAGVRKYTEAAAR